MTNETGDLRALAAKMFLHPMMKAMAAPSREECTANDRGSNTPTAALVFAPERSDVIEAVAPLGRTNLTDGGLLRFQNGLRPIEPSCLVRADSESERCLPPC